jgi:type VI secretion system secreted protein VgrG
MPPYELPANKTQSGIKTRSSLKGTADNYNEIRFEDKKGEEQVLVHAEKDLDTTVEHDESRDVGHNRDTTIGSDDTLSIGSSRTATIGGSDKETVSGSQSISVGSRSVSVGGKDTLTVGATLDITAVGPITITAPVITLQAAVVVVSGVLQAQSVVSPLYSPGVGNLI